MANLTLNQTYSTRRKPLAILLWIVSGLFGTHWFYLKYRKKGLDKLLMNVSVLILSILLYVFSAVILALGKVSKLGFVSLIGTFYLTFAIFALILLGVFLVIDVHDLIGTVELRDGDGLILRTLKYKTQKLIWGIIFIMPWLIGFSMLFLYPFIQSMIYSFYELTPQVGGIILKFVGLKNYLYALNEHVHLDTSYKLELLNTIRDALINLPVMIIFSLFIGVLLNQEFRGRAIVRAIFFIPVILNSAAVATALSGGGAITDILLEENTFQIFDLTVYLMNFGIGQNLISFVVALIDRIYAILTLSGVPILLFLAAIQSVPKHLYEAAKIEGATGYEMFWLITLPNVSVHIITVVIYAIVDTFLTSPAAKIITITFGKSNLWGLSSAMSYIYVLVILALLALLFLLIKIFKIGESHYE